MINKRAFLKAIKAGLNATPVGIQLTNFAYSRDKARQRKSEKNLKKIQNKAIDYYKQDLFLRYYKPSEIKRVERRLRTLVKDDVDHYGARRFILRELKSTRNRPFIKNNSANKKVLEKTIQKYENLLKKQKPF